MKTITLDEWWKEGIRLFGEDRINWKFVCPKCKTIQSAKDFLEIIDFPKEKIGTALGYSCIGRFIDEKGCDWSLGGLFQIHTVEIALADGEKRPIFDFARELDCLFEFLSDPEGLSEEEIREELIQNGVDVDLLQERIKDIVTKGLMKRRTKCPEKKI